MTPPLAPKNQTPFDDEISLLDIIQFFKDHFKRILFFIILGGILGYLYWGKVVDPVYDGSVLLSPALVAGKYVTDPNTTLTKLKMNTYYSKEVFLACNPMFYKDKDKDKDIDYDMSDIVKASITKDGNLIELAMSGSNKETIHACLENIASHITVSQKTIADPLSESKKTFLNYVEKKLKHSEEFREKLREQLNDKQTKNLKTTEPQFATDVLYANIAFNNTSEIEALVNQINQIKIELSFEQTKDAGMVLPINNERKSFPSAKLGLFLGLFLGGMLGFFVSLFRNMKIN
jgi:predicted DNA-binding protein YlxM (UPF0122 family)